MNLYTQHFYPDGKYMSAYFKQMQRTAKEALELIEKGASQDKILAKLAEHYQYAANARPFGQINNSLFMNEINTLLQKAGMKPMPHGILDHVAQRLQPEAFKKYFIDEYKKTALDTPNNVKSNGNNNIGGANRAQKTMSNPIEQSREFNRTHKVGCDEKIADGYKDGGRSARIYDDGSVQSSREIIVVDRKRDIALQKMIQEVKAKTANMNPKQKAAFLQSYVHQKCGDGYIASDNLMAWEDGVRNKEVLLGDIINAKPPVAVCRHRSLLSKILGDEIGLHIELQRGNFYNKNGEGGGHAWNVIKFEDGTSAIYDAMHNKTSNTTPGAVDDYAKQYYTTRDEDLYSNGASR